MRLLLSFVNSTIALAGYDWKEGRIFWALSSERLKAGGICYHGSDLCVGAGDRVVRLSPTGSSSQIVISGPYNPRLHGIHPIDEFAIGVVDTGNSTVRIINLEGHQIGLYNPVGAWLEIPDAAIHLNDFVVTPYGVLGSCFDYRPWRTIRELISDDDWCCGGYGLVLNLSSKHNSNCNAGGCVVGCGFNHPHSLAFHAPFLFLCSSATGIFHVSRLASSGVLVPHSEVQITKTHFLRGACKIANYWYLGGSTFRHERLVAENLEIYRLDVSTGRLNTRVIEGRGEIYDILPWRDDLLEPIIARYFAGFEDHRCFAIDTSRSSDQRRRIAESVVQE
jgi:hypothetical protein